MKYHGYEEVKHTADLALRVWAPDFHALLIQSASGMYDLIGILHQREKPVAHSLELPNGSPEEILVDFLNELVFLLEESNQAFDQFCFLEDDANLSIEMKGYQVSSYHRQIKAVTFHNLEIKEGSKGFETTITFDI